MSYSIISIMALILNIIINREAFRHFKIRCAGCDAKQRAVIRYNHFLAVANVYFVVDIAWGILYEHHEIQGLFPILYADCILYFLFMFLTMLTWIRYVVAYLDGKGRRIRLMLCTVWAMFTLGIIYLIVNCFYPFIFSFNEKHEYITESGRHIGFIFQIVLYMVTTIYMFHLAQKSRGGEKVRYIAVGLTCFVMDISLALQIFDPKYPVYTIGLMVGICVVHSFVEAGEMKEKQVYDHIASGLAEDYEAMYYINIETGHYREFSTSSEYESMNVPVEGRDFYTETKANVEKYVHPDDKEFAKSLYLKETMMKNLKERKSYSYKYRVMVGDHPRYFRFTVMRANDDRHCVLCEKDIDDEITAETMRLENQKKHITFSQIAESLAANYDVIYYVNAENSSYVSYECHNIYGQLDMQKSGEDFYEESRKDVQQIVHQNDREMVLGFMDRDHMISALKDRKRSSIDYRIVGENKTFNVRMTVRKTSDGTHFIIGIENIDAEVNREKQHLEALNTEKELARRDELTGVKNKTAYHELEKAVQSEIDNGEELPVFALVICDANNLKKINDSEGHMAGDKYIRDSAAILCEIFAHSPVFRVGGDEFVIFLQDSDYSNRAELMQRLRDRIMENLHSGTGPILASGIAEYDPEKDSLVPDIFDRADKEMYENKQKLKKEEDKRQQ